MAGVNDRISELRDRSEYLRKRWDERFALTVRDREGWREWLEVLAEHPGMSVHNAAAVVQHRLTYDVHDTQELLTFDQAKELGGHVRRGARAIPIAVPRAATGEDGAQATRFETEFRFLARDCEGLDRDRYQGRPRKVNPSDADSMDMFVRATSGIDLDGLGPEAEWAFERRYGLLDPSDPLPPVPDDAETRALVARCGAIQAHLSDVCRRLDRALKLEAHPEWAEGQAPAKAASERKLDEVIKSAAKTGITAKVGRRPDDAWGYTIRVDRRIYYISDSFDSESQAKHQAQNFVEMLEMQARVGVPIHTPDIDPGLEGSWYFVEQLNGRDNGYAYDEFGLSAAVVATSVYGDEVDWGYVIFDADDSVTYASDAPFNTADEGLEAAKAYIDERWTERLDADDLRDYIEENGELPQDYFEDLNRARGGGLDMESATRVAKVGLGLTTAAAASVVAPSAEGVRASVRQARGSAVAPQDVAVRDVSRTQARGV